jgi:hypothetical protein
MIKKAEILPKEVEVCQWTGHNPDEMIWYLLEMLSMIYMKILMAFVAGYI